MDEKVIEIVQHDFKGREKHTLLAWDARLMAAHSDTLDSYTLYADLQVRTSMSTEHFQATINDYVQQGILEADTGQLRNGAYSAVVNELVNRGGPLDQFPCSSMETISRKKLNTYEDLVQTPVDWLMHLFPGVPKLQTRRTTVSNPEAGHTHHTGRLSMPLGEIVDFWTDECDQILSLFVMNQRRIEHVRDYWPLLSHIRSLQDQRHLQFESHPEVFGQRQDGLHVIGIAFAMAFEDLYLHNMPDPILLIDPHNLHFLNFHIMSRPHAKRAMLYKQLLDYLDPLHGYLRRGIVLSDWLTEYWNKHAV